MRRALLLIALLPLAAACVDGLGLRSSCSAQMRSVTLQQGGPPDETQRDEDRGDYVEEWYFDETRRRYTFRWGVSYQTCQVQSASFVRSPSSE